MENFSPKITFLIATKLHNKRFYRIDNKKTIVNTAPGDVVDSGVTRSDVGEFFQQTYFPLKGKSLCTFIF